MRRFYLAIAFIGVFNISIYANDYIRLFWSLGDVGVSFDSIGDDFSVLPFINVGNVNWITRYGFGFGFKVFNIESSRDWKQAQILPIEINYSPFGDNDMNLFLTFYGRGGWVLNYNTELERSLKDRSSLFGAAGLRFAWIPRLGQFFSIFTGAFIEYTSRKELRMGVSVDLSVLVVLFTAALVSRDSEGSGRSSHRHRR